METLDASKTNYKGEHVGVFGRAVETNYFNMPHKRDYQPLNFPRAVLIIVNFGLEAIQLDSPFNNVIEDWKDKRVKESELVEQVSRVLGIKQTQEAGAQK